MTRILFFLLLLLFVACTLLAGCDASCGVGKNGKGGDTVVPLRQIKCRVLEFSFCDARSDAKRSMMIGPFRLLGVAEEHIYSQLLPPFGSSLKTLAPYYADGFMDASVAMYYDKLGFFEECQPCWRLRVVTPAATDVQNLILEVNYSYCYDDASGSGYVKAMQRLPLRAMDAVVCGVGRNLNGAMLLRHCSDDSVPFSIVCLSFMLPKENFHPL